MPTLRSLVEARIKSTVPAFKEISGAADMRTILANNVACPGCYIYRERNTVTPNTMMTVVSQRRTEEIGLIIVTRNVKDARGGVNSDINEELCDLVEAQLLGFTATEFYTAMEYGGGGLVLLKDGLHFWREIYRSSRLIRSV